MPLALVLAVAHLGYQLDQLATHARVQTGAREDWQRTHRFLEAHGVRPPCVLDGNSALVPVAHVAGCRPRAHPRLDRAARASTVATGHTVATSGTPDALVMRGRLLPAWATEAGWRAYSVPGTYDPRWHVAFPARAVLGEGR